MALKFVKMDGASYSNNWQRSWRASPQSALEKHEPMPGRKANIDRVFHALGDPTRRAIVEKLSEGPITVSQLAAPLAITLAAVVQHLQVLEESGLVQTEKVGRVRTCSIIPAGLSVAEQWIADRRSIWERRLDRLGDLLIDSDNDRSK
jgi:DNA-binding transcriptional ArsR family regulator